MSTGNNERRGAFIQVATNIGVRTMGDEAIKGRINTRDPNMRSGPIVEATGEDGKKLPRTIVGSTHLTAEIDGKWFVVNTRGEKILQQEFVTEADAIEEAQKRNPEESKRGLSIE
ncbi:hypothetical protein P106B_73 [Rhizobium phage vB_RglS_P106B]|uniref:Uncharacterized protein n=1 Tax=Rhizobium phage vB_RglS_P106B TaxID=1458697 RepID=W6EKJ4_9CAUD|nr:hypothetical protein P106B_73 [Rhizobium phage vB_RglS_P106B]AHJ10756.1 hypothetical protein P106B_73 [Rhizobium phage vB_RglS_P106B]